MYCRLIFPLQQCTRELAISSVTSQQTGSVHWFVQSARFLQIRQAPPQCWHPCSAAAPTAPATRVVVLGTQARQHAPGARPPDAHAANIAAHPQPMQGRCAQQYTQRGQHAAAHPAHSHTVPRAYAFLHPQPNHDMLASLSKQPRHTRIASAHQRYKRPRHQRLPYHHRIA
jgi:hypothetical protein